MARSRGHAQNPNQMLIIALVLMVILCLAEALVAYSFFSDAREEAAKAEKNEDLAKKRLEDLNRQKVLRAAWRLMVGFDEKDDLQDLATYQKSYEPDLKAEMDKGAQVGVTWVRDQKAGIDLPKNPMAKDLKKLREQEVGKALKERDDAKAEVEKLTKQVQEEQANCQRLKNEFDKKLAELNDDASKRFSKVNDAYKKAGDELEKALPDNAKNKEEIQKLKEDNTKLEAALKAEVEKNKKAVQELKERIGLVDLTGLELPKGKIFRLDAGGQLAYLDLGARDYVKPGLTFSIFGPGQYRESRFDAKTQDETKRKGQLEVVRVLDDHSCEARITWTRNKIQAPIMTGDQVYNPAWTPGRREHVAITGIVDLTGEGKDNTAEFIRSLEKMGVIVDAYVDINVSPATRRGPGMSRELTGYLIIGEKPNLDQGAGGREMDPRMARRMEVRNEFDKLQREAVELGITTIPVRHYMALIGMKVPKPSLDDWTTYATPRANGDAPPAAKPDGGAKPDEAKKEDPKEMKKDDAKEMKKDKE